jgi:hypothetical protein
MYLILNFFKEKRRIYCFRRHKDKLAKYLNIMQNSRLYEAGFVKP